MDVESGMQISTWNLLDVYCAYQICSPAEFQLCISDMRSGNRAVNLIPAVAPLAGSCPRSPALTCPPSPTLARIRSTLGRLSSLAEPSWPSLL